MGNKTVLKNKTYFREVMYEMAFVRKNRLTEYFIERNYNKLIEEGLDRVNIIKKSMNAMLDMNMYIDDKLPEIKVPVCFVWGEDDQLVPIRYGYKGYDLIPHDNKKFFVFQKTGHYPSMERPRDFAEVIFKFTSPE
jgi:pimeloyl-ACP methyl ester carboxylesterase